MSAMRSLMTCLPVSSRHVVQAMTNFLSKFPPKSEVSKIFGHLILRPADLKLKNGEEHSQVPKPVATEQIGEHVMKYLIKERLRIFEISENIKFHMKDGHQLISMATRENLWEALIDPFQSEANFMEIYLFVYPYFTNSVDLLDKIIAVCQQEVTKPWQQMQQARGLRILKSWVGTHGNQLRKDKPFILKFEDFILKNPEFRSEIIFRKFVSLCSEPSEGSGSFIKDESITITDIDILDHDPYTVGAIMTQIDYNYLKNIQLEEFLKKAFADVETSPNLAAMAEAWNRRVFWVVSEIVRRPKKPKRAAAIVHFVKIAESCLQANNFHGTYALTAGLSHPAVSRLDKTWAKVPKRIMTVFQSLLERFDMTFNYKNYRSYLNTVIPPGIPYIGLFPKDITSLEETPNEINGCINFIYLMIKLSFLQSPTSFEFFNFNFQLENLQPPNSHEISGKTQRIVEDHQSNQTVSRFKNENRCFFSNFDNLSQIFEKSRRKRSLRRIVDKGTAKTKADGGIKCICDSISSNIASSV
eukprot:TRINITY_DN3213_c0_g1_i2.p1 TRINITY_DN3213_c0_g1~~TRINITY_DN3213_c0_g1_i2.p1  ORF type:complete len:528 (+),score=178.19 TRINITY_DN3213_c0_g1_i2:1761-3344(+)